jgi:RNA polymerase sigma factor (sigma-70 family)
MSLKIPDISQAELQRLIQGCIAMNRTSQKELYQLYCGTLFSLCLRYAKNREEAEEVLQDGFVKVFLHIHQFRHAGSFEGWLRKIFINCALQRFREQERDIRILPLMEEFYLPAEVAITSRLFEKELIAALQSLSPAYRMVFNLYVLEGFKHREIAVLLNISEGTSKSNLFDARNMLKQYLKQEYKIAK